MAELISIEKLIEEAKKSGIDFGKGDPYNRLRYYTKIGWLPHMIRKKDSSGNMSGHYEYEALEQLITIEELKSKGISNDAIAQQIKIRNRFQPIIKFINSKETRKQFIPYATLIILVLIFANELGIIRLNKPKDSFSPLQQATISKQIVNNGTAFVPKGQKKIFIQASNAKSNFHINVTFTQDYSPAARYWISNVEDFSGFTVELDAPVFNNSEFNWWITN